MKFLTSIFLLFISACVFSQSIISGKLLNEQKEVLFNANVIIKKPGQLEIIAYAITNINGEFEIKCPYLIIDSLEIKITLINYAPQVKVIANKTQVINFTLIEKKTELPMVTVQARPITVNGDTTNYNVASFAGKQDKFIGDVIAKLPGIEMDANGQIKYNGKPISNYYIDGLDLLESRYNIANQNIPLNLVDQVQLLDNHQPIKMLDSFNTSTTPALNIKLKPNAKNKLIGRAKLGAGISPLLWDNEITALQFNPAFQLITSYKNNNSGNILGNELANNVNIRRFGDATEQNVKESILNSFTTSKPVIGENKYLFNNTHLSHFSILKLLKNKAQLKLNGSYLNDYKTTESHTNTVFYLPSDTLLLAEKQNNSVNDNQINANLNYSINKEKFYLKNAASIKMDYGKENNNTVNSSPVRQILINPFYQYSNDFALNLLRHKKVYSIASVVNYKRTPQTLEVEPGQFTSIFNQSVPYEQLIQYAAINNFNTNNNFSFLTKMGKLQQQIKIGAEYIQKTIHTSAGKIVNQVSYPLNDSFQNKINWQNTRLYAEARSTITKKKNQLEIAIPLELNSVNIRNQLSSFKDNTTDIFFNPNLNLTTQIAQGLQTQLGYSMTHGYGSPTLITQGYILKTYRNINQNDSLIPKQKQSLYTFSIFFKDPLKALFGYATAAYVTTRNNLITTQSYSNFYTKTIALQLANTQKSLLLTSNISKYFITARTNIALGYYYNNIQIPQYLQSSFVNIHSAAHRVQLKINYAKKSWFNAETNTGFDVSKSKITSPTSVINNTPVYRIQQNLKLYFYLNKKITFFFNNDFYSVSDKKNTGNYLFSDAGIKIKLKKSDLELTGTNVTNTRSYTSLVISSNQMQTIKQEVRPANFMVRYWLNFK